MKRMHRFLSILTAGTLLLGSAALPVSAAGVLYGDADGSGDVDLRDAVLLAKASAGIGEGLDSAGRTAADVNGDGTVDGTDLKIMLQYLAGLRTSLTGTASSVYLAATDLTADIVSGTVESKAPDAQYITAQLGFAADLMRNEWTAHKNQNVLVSPLSVSLALAMTANGANGDTLSQMENVLGDGMTIDELNACCRGYLDLLPQSEDTSLSIANSIWFDENRLSVPQKFLQTTADYYKASAFRACFSNPDTITDINAWVNLNTHEMIPRLLDPDKGIDTHTVMILMNALAFEAKWKAPYHDGDRIGDRTFYAADGTEQTVTMMYSDEHSYLATEHATGFVKPYTDGYSFAAVLPNEGISIGDYAASLDAAEISALLSSKTDCAVHAGLPKFSYDFGDSLVETLKSMGMPTAFDENYADFSGLTEDPLQQIFISDVIHKTHIEVGEDGTRAAAVTAVIMAENAVMPIEEQKEVILNRPFLYMIIDDATQLPIFIGTVTSIEA